MIKSEVNAISGRTSRNRATIRRKSSAVCLRFIAFSILSEPDCTGRCKNGISAGLSRCARISSSSCRWGRGGIAQPLNPLDLRQLAQQPCEAPYPPIRPLAVVGVHILPQQRNLARPLATIRLASATMLATGRDASAPRVYGTTQNEQNLSQPS